MSEHLSKYCKGCPTLYIKDIPKGKLWCKVAKADQEHRCPCSNCLVKPTCSSTCREFDELWYQSKVVKDSLNE